MNLVTYVKSLLPTYKKDKVLESCDLTLQTLTETTIPCYGQASAFFKENPIKNNQIITYSKEYSKLVKVVTPNTFIEHIHSVVVTSEQLIKDIEEHAKKDFSANETNLAVTYKKANLLRLIQVVEFVNIYSCKFLNYVYSAETNTTSSDLCKAERDFVESHFTAFCQACSIIVKASKTLERGLKDIPDAVVSDLSETTLPETIGQHKLDPFSLMSLGFSGSNTVVFNIFYLFGLLKAEVQASRYKNYEQRRNILQLKLLNLQKIKDNDPDAHIEKEIQYTQDRIDKIESTLDKWSKEYNV